HYRCAVRLLLPPSEGKLAGGRGKPLSERPASSDLDPARATVRDALEALLVSADRETIARALALPASVVDEAVTDNGSILSTATMPAVARYAGIVYDGLCVRELSAAARRRADRDVLIFSGLFGVLRGGEPIPVYRVPAKASLPGLGIAGTFWRRHLDSQLPSMLGGGLIIDLRSADYAAMWKPRDEAARARLISVRILSPRPAGDFAVISYPSKYHKGRLAAALLERAAGSAPVASPQDILDTWSGLGGLDGRIIDSPAGVAVELRTKTAAVVSNAR
ncbi:MAG: uncharacterized protein QOK10_2891, partial [Pseudonocardiales bacterium]|nr:uncharacterized protein [Pseudonocardiales bacterium]